MAYNNGRENRKWLIWKEAEEKIYALHSGKYKAGRRHGKNDRNYVFLCMLEVIFHLFDTPKIFSVFFSDTE